MIFLYVQNYIFLKYFLPQSPLEHLLMLHFCGRTIYESFLMKERFLLAHLRMEFTSLFGERQAQCPQLEAVGHTGAGDAED